MALGASAHDLQTGILLRTLGLAGLGMFIGITSSWALARLVNSLLFGVAPTDPATFFSVFAILTTAAAIAGYLPARRASQIDPIMALRVN